MAIPSRMPQSTVRNDGAGPYAIFVCEKCRREFRSQPVRPDNAQLKQLGDQTVGNLLRNIPVLGETMATSANTVIDAAADNLAQAGAEVVSGLLQNIPLVGDAVAHTVAAADPRRAQTLTPPQLYAAWQEVQGNFRECPTCHRIVCTADFDEASGFCVEHRPQGAGAAPAPAPAASYGYGYGYGSDAATPAASYNPAPAAPAAGASAPMARCPNDGTLAAPGTRFCPNCGSPMTQPAAAQAAAICPKCGADTQGAKFCPNCGNKMEAAPAVCPNCGAEAKGARFCPNCGTKLG